jgi:hypothetical protein
MDGSRTIRLLKRDGTAEDFDPHKLAVAIWRALSRRGGQYQDAADLAIAIGIYLQRGPWRVISSAAVFEMTVKVLRRVHFDAAAVAMESFRAARAVGRRRLRVDHGDGKVTCWEKGWLARVGSKSWQLAPQTARILAALVERDLLSQGGRIATRVDVTDRFNQYVAEYGLADAVPVNN